MRFLRYVFVFLCCCFHFSSFAQQSLRLTQNWQFLKGDLGGVWEAVRLAKPGDPESVPLWKNITLPHCFNATDAVEPDLNYYEGPGWYRTALKIDQPYQNGRILLHFEGAGQKTKVFVYNQQIGEHVGGYDEWTFDITDAVEAFEKNPLYHTQFREQIPLEIRCDNTRDLGMIPSDMSDFNVYGGLYRYLDLIYTPALSINQLFATPTVDAKGQIGKLKINASFYNPDHLSYGDVKILIKDPKGNLVREISRPHLPINSSAQQLADLEINKPILWSPNDPQLYTLETLLTANNSIYKQIDHIGFRNFEFQTKGPFFLNGERLLLRGTHRHEDHAGVGAAMTEQMIRKEMQMIKDMGVNFIRLAHYQQSPIVLNLCDSLGILVWEEIPWCRGGLGGEVYQEQAKRMLTNMIEQHYNHPAVIIWGLGNENDWPGDFPTFSKDSIRAFMKQLNNLSHHLDPTRKTAIRRCDFCKDIVDVYSPSIWAGWYRGLYTEYKDVSQKEFDSVDHFIHIEWGADSHAGRHSETPDAIFKVVKATQSADERAGDASLFGGNARVSKDGDWSETYTCNLIDWHLKEQETMPWLTGSAYWVFKDFSTPLRPDNPIPYVNQKGVVARDFTKKESYYVFQSYWTTNLMAHIYGHTWPVRWGDAGEEKMVKVYSNATEAELFLNGKSMGIRKRNSQDFPAVGLRWMVVFKEGENHIKVVAKKGNEEVTDEIIQQYQTQKWGKPAYMTLEKTANKDGKVTIEVKLFDAKGVQCLDANNIVEFGLTGDGKLIDDQGTDTGSRKVQLYNGRAIISLYTNGGESIASVKSERIPTVFLNL